jgi:hypothetical protein
MMRRVEVEPQWPGFFAPQGGPCYFFFGVLAVSEMMRLTSASPATGEPEPDARMG